MSFLQIKKHHSKILIMDESFPAKHFKSNKMINHATSGSEATLQINEEIVGFKVPDKSSVDHSFPVLQMQLVNTIG